MGQGQEFREFKAYSLGDDLRHLDVRNSLLRKQVRPLEWENWLLRRFEAEEQMQIVISLDTRATMLFPRIESRMPKTSLSISKLQIARWVAEAVARIASKTRDVVILHRLFDPDPDRPVIEKLYGASADDRVSSALTSVIGTDPAPDQLSMRGLSPYLPPAAVWIIVSDFYFLMESVPDTKTERGIHLHRHLLKEQDGMRWIILLDLDTWAVERALLGEGARRIEGPFTEPKEMHVTKQLLDETEASIRAHKQPFTEWSSYGAWHWWQRKDLHTLEQARTFFMAQFQRDERIAELFRRDV
jgi:hypothetical protein